MTGAVTAAAGSVGTGSNATSKRASSTARAAEARNIAFWSRKARSAQAGTRRWLTVVRGRPPQQQQQSRVLAATESPSSALRAAKLWERREHKAWVLAHHPPARRDWYCIHRYEGSWTDHGAPYWGGLQMDYSFQSTYGPWLLRHKGTADHWTSLEQIWTAVRAWHERGFAPWANTAHDCGVY